MPAPSGLPRRLLAAAPRLALGAGMVALSGAVARSRAVPAQEEAVFRGVNDLPEPLHPPVWAVMQSGSLAGLLALAGVARLAGRPRLATTLAVTGTATWGGAKVVKRGFGRGRPAAHLDDVRVRGGEQRGLGFPSGHAAVAVALATVAGPELGAVGRAAAWAAATTTAFGRLYVGAHLPADIVGGAGLGLAAGSLGRAVAGLSASGSR